VADPTTTTEACPVMGPLSTLEPTPSGPETPATRTTDRRSRKSKGNERGWGVSRRWVFVSYSRRMASAANARRLTAAREPRAAAIRHENRRAAGAGAAVGPGRLLVTVRSVATAVFVRSTRRWSIALLQVLAQSGGRHNFKRRALTSRDDPVGAVE